MVNMAEGAVTPACETSKSEVAANLEAATSAEHQIEETIDVMSIQGAHADKSEELRWMNHAITVSYVSIVVTLITGTVGIVCATAFSSMAMLGYGLESFVDVFSSVLVAWRFKAALASPNRADEEAYSHHLEKRSGVGISLVFVLIALIVGGQASGHLADEHHPENDTALVVLAVLSIIIFTVLGIAKWHISSKLHSATMKKDAICSLAVGLLSLAVFISATAYENHKEVWWFDAAVAVGTAVFLLIYGSRTLFCHGHKWWTSDFWNDDGVACDSTAAGVNRL